MQEKTGAKGVTHLLHARSVRVEKPERENGNLAQHMDKADCWGSVDNWRDAIKEFANLVGWHYKANDSCRTEARLIDQVVNEISATLQRKRCTEFPNLSKLQDVHFNDEETSYSNQVWEKQWRWNAQKLQIFVIALFRPYPISLEVDLGATIRNIKGSKYERSWS